MSGNSTPAGKAIGLLVLGLGNVLLGDDGLGAAAVARVERNYRIPPAFNWKTAARSACRFWDCSPNRSA